MKNPNPFITYGKFLIEGTQQELERVHKALSSVISNPHDTQSQVIEEKFNVIFRKRSDGNVEKAQQGALDEIDDGN